MQPVLAQRKGHVIELMESSLLVLVLVRVHVGEPTPILSLELVVVPEKTLAGVLVGLMQLVLVLRKIPAVLKTVL